MLFHLSKTQTKPEYRTKTLPNFVRIVITDVFGPNLKTPIWRTAV